MEAVLDAEKLEAERADGVVGALLPKATGRDVREYGDAVATTHESFLSAVCLLAVRPSVERCARRALSAGAR